MKTKLKRVAQYAGVIVALVVVVGATASTEEGDPHAVAYPLNQEHALIVGLPSGLSTKSVGLGGYSGYIEVADIEGANYNFVIEDMESDAVLSQVFRSLSIYAERGDVESQEFSALGYGELVHLYGKGAVAYEFRHRDKIVFAQGRRLIHGVDYSYWEDGFEKIQKDGEMVEADGPVEIIMYGLFQNRYMIRARHRAAPSRYADPMTLETFLSGVKIVPVAEVDVPSYRTFNGTNTPISERRDYWVDMNLVITVPAAWKATEEQIKAGPGQEQGRYVARFVGPTEGDARAPLFMASFIGLEVGPRSKPDFIATGDALVASFIGDDRELVERKEIDLDATRQLARSGGRYVQPTGQTVLSIWEGTTIDSGARLRVAVYTAGGLTVAANFLYVADASAFDATRPTIDTMLETMRVGFRSSAIQLMQ